MIARVQVASGCFRAFELLLGERRLEASAQIEVARRSTGLSGIALDDIEAPLSRFLHACDKEARLSALGRHITRWDVHRLLSNLLRLRAEEIDDPGIRDRPIGEPVFITGMPRSGSTFLHHLMAEDDQFQTPRCWQTIYPYPGGGQDGEDARARRVETQLRLFATLCPDIRSVHPINSRSPQECTDIMAHVFQSLRFETSYEIPSYRSWLALFGYVEAYRFHKSFLQHLQGRHTTRTWVLKCPDHVFTLDALRQVYPDAKLIFLHRDPSKVIPSVTRLTEVLRSPFAARVDRRQIGRQVMEDWERGAKIMVEADRAHSTPRDRILHLHYTDLVAHPMDAVERIYRHLGRPLHPDTAAKVARYVHRNVRGGYGRNTYRLSDYGIGADEVRERFRPYMDHFGIAPEGSGQGAGTAG